MAQDLIIANAQYNDVPSISVPKQGGGSASFVDTTDADAVAEDIATGKTAYVGGSKITGTGGGGGSATKYGCNIDLWLGELNASGQLQQVTGGNVDLVVTDIKSLASYSLQYKFMRCNALKSVEFRDLTTASNTYALSYAFSTCTNLLTASFPELTAVGSTYVFNYTFTGCTKLTTVSFASLKSISSTCAMQYCFNGCSALTTVEFPALKTIGATSGSSTTYRQFYNTFTGTGVTTLTFPSLEGIYCNGTATSHGTFATNTTLKKLYFPKLTHIDKTSAYSGTTGAKNIFNGCTGLTEIHFAEDNQTAIESSSGYATKWSAPSGCSILFDL